MNEQEKYEFAANFIVILLRVILIFCISVIAGLLIVAIL